MSGTPHDQAAAGEVTAWWATELTEMEPDVLRLRGFAIQDLIGHVGFVDVIWLLLRGDLPSPHEASLLEAALVAGVDHGPQAPSIAAARMAITCGVGLNNAIATGVNLLGDVHGGAGQQCMALLEQIRIEADNRHASVAESVSAALRAYSEEGCFVPGFGHRFHRHDPRRDPLVDAVQHFVAEGHGSGRHLEIACEIEAQLRRPGSRPIPMNIDGATAVVFSELGFAPELGRGLFVISRAIGVLAHAWEERTSGSRIKGPIPSSLVPDYRGPGPRSVDAVLNPSAAVEAESNVRIRPQRGRQMAAGEDSE